MMNVWKVLLLS